MDSRIPNNNINNPSIQMTNSVQNSDVIVDSIPRRITQNFPMSDSLIRFKANQEHNGCGANI
ncbi:hypothetical protein Glove_155g8 [Diversispora epigaea]|uniref:Uncharacterized protein n=1 Tax=Diversispora epigaea TaxID=1348612 RepID=A0A397IS77_9GLOM|nr:hypothetical protein Glove_155g8 [Diversispora epigaea]